MFVLHRFFYHDSHFSLSIFVGSCIPCLNLTGCNVNLFFLSLPASTSQCYLREATILYFSFVFFFYSVDIDAHDPPNVGKVSVNCRLSGGEVSAVCRPTCVSVDVGRYVGRISADISA